MTITRQAIAFVGSAAIAAMLAGSAAAHAIHRHHPPGRQSGTAMYYGPGFEGKTMANGKIFDPNALTAASRTLPLGTRARVTNRRSGQSTIVTITDRGRLRAPYLILDVTPRVARAIGLTERKGVVPVLVEPIGFVSRRSWNRAWRDSPAPELGRDFGVARSNFAEV